MSPIPARALLRRLPKAELHCHLDGSVRPSTLLELGRDHQVPMPADDVDALREFMVVRDAQNLEDYLTRFDITLSVMQTAESLERIAYELAEDAAAEGVRYIEMRYSPVLNTRHDLTLGDTVEAALRGVERAQRDHGIVSRLIICALRNLSPGISMELARLAVDYRGRGVVGFDLAGGERGHPASEHARAFEHAREHGLSCTCHAGEGAGAHSVREAVYACGAQRIGHATRLIEDAALTEDLNERHVALEICLTSNVQTHAAESYEAHPFRRYFDAGMNVVLNTDNRLMSGTTLTDEYIHAAERLDFSFDELCAVALNGFESAFLSDDERALLIGKAKADIAVLRSEQW
jgi:adenosine deaminase